jgi:hypothetical protein
LAEVDLRVGVRTLVATRAPPISVVETCTSRTFTGVVPHARIVHVFNFADQHGNRLVPVDLGLPHGSPNDGDHWSPSVILAMDGPR